MEMNAGERQMHNEGESKREGGKKIPALACLPTHTHKHIRAHMTSHTDDPRSESTSGAFAQCFMNRRTFSCDCLPPLLLLLLPSIPRSSRLSAQ